MSTVNVWSGGITDTTATVVAKVSGASTRLAWADNESLSSPTYTAAVAPSAQGICSYALSGLPADTQLWYAVEVDGVLDTAMIGRLHTHGAVGEPYSFTFGHATCAGDGTAYPVTGALAPSKVSNHPVFDDIRGQDPLFFVHGGDLCYYNPGSGQYVPDASVGTYRRMYDDVLSSPRQGLLYRNVPLVYMWDDHEYGPNDSDRTAPGRLNAAQVYRERVPHYPLAAGDTGTEGVYYSFQVGRVLFVVTDGRYYRDPPAQADPRTMFGSAQLSWMDTLLGSSTAEMLCWVQEQSWTVTGAPGGSNWASYAAERDQLVQMLGDHGWLNRMFMVVGDSHAMAMDTGGTNPYGGFPEFMFSPLDSTLSAGPALDLGRRGSTTGGSRGQWGTVRVDDLGSVIRVTAKGWYYQ